LKQNYGKNIYHFVAAAAAAAVAARFFFTPVSQLHNYGRIKRTIVCNESTVVCTG
jgi:hypothetical protein